MLKVLISLLIGIAIGAVVANVVWSKRISHALQDSLQTGIQRNLDLLSIAETSQDQKVKNRLQSILTIDLEALREIASKNDSLGQEARLIQSQVLEWRSRHPTAQLNPALSKEIENANSMSH